MFGFPLLFVFCKLLHAWISIFPFPSQCALVVCCCSYVWPSVTGQNLRESRKQQTGGTSNWSTEDKALFKEIHFGEELIRRQQVPAG